MTRRIPMLKIVDDYLAFRRSLGFELESVGSTLREFGHYVDGTGYHGPITTELALRWATLPRGASSIWHARRLGMVRGLARHCLLTDRRTEVPPSDLLGPMSRRPPPYVYSEQEIRGLLAASMCLGPRRSLTPYTYSTLIGLLASAGLRISEALRLTTTDIDWNAGILSITKTKFRKSRLLPLHDSTLAALRAYEKRRVLVAPHDDSFFVSDDGRPVKIWQARSVFRGLRERIGLTGQHGRWPRLHDLRHTFAVRRLASWYKQGLAIDRRLAALSTYLGHVQVTDTYWYLSAVPELLAAATSRFERRRGVWKGGRQ
jgi:integrase